MRVDYLRVFIDRSIGDVRSVFWANCDKLREKGVVERDSAKTGDKLKQAPTVGT